MLEEAAIHVSSFPSTPCLERQVIDFSSAPFTFLLAHNSRRATHSLACATDSLAQNDTTFVIVAAHGLELPYFSDCQKSNFPTHQTDCPKWEISCSPWRKNERLSSIPASFNASPILELVGWPFAAEAYYAYSYIFPQYKNTANFFQGDALESPCLEPNSESSAQLHEASKKSSIVPLSHV